MYEKFESRFKLDRPCNPTSAFQMPNKALGELLGRYAGASFNRGLFRIVDSATVAEANNFIALAYPELKGTLCPFGFDWEGNIWAVDHRNPDARVHHFIIGTGDVMKSPHAIESCLDTEFTSDLDLLHIGKHNEWLAAGNPSPEFSECVTYINPPHLGGEDVIENMEIVPVYDYWRLMGKLIAQLFSLPPDLAVTAITLNYKTGEVSLGVRPTSPFEDFCTSFRPDEDYATPQKIQTPSKALSEFLSSFAGASFNNGIYRVLNEKMRKLANEYIAVAFPEFAGKIFPFACDWCGNIFAVDADNAGARVHIFEPAAGGYFVAPMAFLQFHEDLAKDCKELLARDFYDLWLRTGSAPTYSQSVTFKLPLFLGGTNTVDNLEIGDTEIYWHLLAQARAKTRNLPPGTKVRIHMGQ